METIRQRYRALHSVPRGRWIRVLGGTMMILGIWLLYSASADAPLIFDDLDFFAGSYVANFGASLQPFLPRFWPYATFAHQNLLFGHGPAEMHVGNIFLHGLCVLALQALIARLLAASEGTADVPPSMRHEMVALSAASLFAFHPVAVYAVAYLVQRSMLMATLFALLMWLAYLTGLEQGSKRWLGLSVALYYFAAYSKQHAVLAPVVPLAMSFMLWGPARFESTAKIGRRWLFAAFVAYAVIAIGVTLPSASLLGTSYEPMLVYFQEGKDWHEQLFFLQRIHWMSLLTQCGLFFKYLALWVWPNPSVMSVDMRETFLTDLATPVTWLGAAAYLAFGLMAAGLVWFGRSAARRSCGMLGLGLLTVWGLFAVELMTVRLQEIFVLYRSYLWATGLVIALAVGLNAMAVRFRSNWILLLCVPMGVILVLGAEQRLETFTSEKRLWSDAVRLIEQRNLPAFGAERAYNNRGVAYAREKDFPRALADYEKALVLNPKYYASYMSRGQVQAELAQFEAALASFDEVLVIRPSFTKARTSRAGVLERMGKKEEALAELKRACDEGDVWGCFAHHKRTNPNAPFLFRPKGAAAD